MKKNPASCSLRLFFSVFGTCSAFGSEVFFQSGGDGFSYPLDEATSWVSGGVPGSSDIAIFDNRVLATTLFARHGGDFDVQGIKVLDPQSINVTSGLGLSGTGSTIDGVYVYDGNIFIGNAGIDLSDATAPDRATNSFFSVSSPITLTANQTWNIPQLLPNLQRSLSLGGSGFSSTRRTAAIDLGGFTVTKTGNGTAALILDRFVFNGTLVVEEGAMTFGNSINSNSDTNIIQDISETFTLQINPDGQGNILQATTADRGKVNWEGKIILNGGTLGLNTGNFRGNLTLGGAIETTIGTSNQIIYEVSSDAPEATLVNIAAPLSGDGDINIQNTSTREQDRLILSGNNSDHAGTLTLSGGTFLAKNTAGTTHAIIDGETILGGNGLRGPLTIPSDSAIHPGDGNGDTEALMTGAVSLNGELRIDYNSSDCDSLIANGTLDLENATLVLLQGATPAALNSYTIADATSINGLSGLVSQNIPAGYALEIIPGGLGQQLTLTGSLLPANYDEWIAQYPGISPADALPEADPDLDGFDNMVEFVLDSSPSQTEPDKVPLLTIEGGNVFYSFRRLLAAHNTGYRAIIEWSTDLDTEIWNELRLTVVSSDEAYDYTSTMIPVGPNAPRVFARIRVTPPD